MSIIQVSKKEKARKRKVSTQKQEAFSKLDLLKKQGTVEDYDMELAIYRNKKYKIE